MPPVDETPGLSCTSESIPHLVEGAIVVALSSPPDRPTGHSLTEDPDSRELLPDRASFLD
jgi:hypothetical protein